MNNYNDFAFGDLFEAVENGKCSEEDVLRDIETFLFGKFEGDDNVEIPFIRRIQKRP